MTWQTRASGSVARFITVAEIDLLANTIDAQFRLAVLLGGYCGLRWGEVAGLQLEQVDLLHKCLTIDRSLIDDGRRLMMGLPKTEASVRRISLPSFMVSEIESHLASFVPVGQPQVLTTSSGNLIRRSNFRRRVWVPAVVEADLAPLRFHDLRHTHAALLIAQGEHPKLIADRLGHASPTTTMKIHSHLFPGLDEGAADRLDKAREEYLTDFRRTSTSTRRLSQ